VVRAMTRSGDARLDTALEQTPSRAAVHLVPTWRSSAPRPGGGGPEAQRHLHVRPIGRHGGAARDIRR
jgi:hypothetical protein